MVPEVHYFKEVQNMMLFYTQNYANYNHKRTAKCLDKANDLIDITTLSSNDVYSNQNMYEYYGIFEQKQFKCNNVDSIGKSSLYLQAYVNDR